MCSKFRVRKGINRHSYCCTTTNIFSFPRVGSSRVNSYYCGNLNQKSNHLLQTFIITPNNQRTQAKIPETDKGNRCQTIWEI